MELRRAKTGTAVSCPIPHNLGKAFHVLDGETPFWTGKSDLDHLTKNWRKIYTKIFKAAGIDGHPHQFRHTAAKRSLVAGLSVSHVATLLANSEDIVRKHFIPNGFPNVRKPSIRLFGTLGKLESLARIRHTNYLTSEIAA